MGASECSCAFMYAFARMMCVAVWVKCVMHLSSFEFQCNNNYKHVCVCNGYHIPSSKCRECEETDVLEVLGAGAYAHDYHLLNAIGLLLHMYVHMTMHTAF